ncbi:DNRLRE domain-containing protein [bacterium]|nr:DNRLRE domain-containing protein [bacterium]
MNFKYRIRESVIEGVFLYTMLSIMLGPLGVMGQTIKSIHKGYGTEIVSKRTMHSKTYLSGDKHSMTTIVSPIPIHYNGARGRYYDINNNIKLSEDQQHYVAQEGLYHAKFQRNYHRGEFISTFTAEEGEISFQSRVLALAYYDRKTRQTYTLARTEDVNAEVEGSSIFYREIFPGVNLEYQNKGNKLKQNIYISRSALCKLPTPQSMKLKAKDVSLVVLSYINIPDNMDVSCNDKLVSSKKSHGKHVIEHEGTELLTFNKKHSKKVYVLVPDEVFTYQNHKGKLKKSKKAIMWRRFYQHDDLPMMMQGVTMRWLEQALKDGAQEIVLDPTISIVGVKSDGYIDEANVSTNYDADDFLLIGNDSHRKRSLIKFDLPTFPAGFSLTKAEMKLYVKEIAGTPRSRTIRVHEVLRNWWPNYLSWLRYNSQSNWSTGGLGFNNADAASIHTVSSVFDAQVGWKIMDLTTLTQSWIDGTANNGILLYAVDEAIGGEVKKICSSNHDDQQYHPQLVLSYPAEAVADYEYNDLGQVEKACFGNGINEVNVYHPDRDWLKKRDYKLASDNLLKFDYLFDDVGNISEMFYTYEADPRIHSNYNYDDLYQLTSFSSDGAGSPSRSYTYDDNGNIQTFAGRSYTYDGIKKNRICSDGLKSYGYDASGRVISRDGSSLNYDIFGNMRSHGNDEYSYNVSGQRIKKVENGETRYYVKGGMATLAEYDGSGMLETEYIQGVGGLLAIADHNNNELQYFIKDHLGSTCKVEPSAFLRDYYPFGESITSAGDETSYQFTGKELDNGTGLYYFGARYYDPGIGRWLTPDPLADKYPSWSPYNYSLNNPIRYIDPDGKEPTTAVLIVGAGLFVAAIAATDHMIKYGTDPAYAAAHDEFFSSTLGVAKDAVNGALETGESLLEKVKTLLKKKKKSAKPKENSNSDQEEVSEHTKGRRKSTEDKHTKHRSGRKYGQNKNEKRSPRNKKYVRPPNPNINVVVPIGPPKKEDKKRKE